MPTYRNPIHGVQQSEALAEAAATARGDRVMVLTYEWYHPVGTPGGPIYIINANDPFSATLEANAPRDAGVTVDFFAAKVEIQRPTESDAEGTPQLRLAVSNVNGILARAMRVVRQSTSRAPWELIERQYAHDDTSGPAVYPPLKMVGTDVEIDEFGVSLQISYGDPANISVPRTTFKRSEYPGLSR